MSKGSVLFEANKIKNRIPQLVRVSGRVPVIQTNVSLYL